VRPDTICRWKTITEDEQGSRDGHGRRDRLDLVVEVVSRLKYCVIAGTMVCDWASSRSAQTR
jgi:hypothetical protein